MGDGALSDEQWLAWTEDTQGDERYTLWIKSLPSGEPVSLLSDIGAGLCWAEDQTASSATLFFTRFDATQRPDSIWQVSLPLNAPAQHTAPTLVLREKDPEFWLGIGKTRSRQWLLIGAAERYQRDLRTARASAIGRATLCAAPAQSGVEYTIDHRPGTFYRVHNQASAHFQLDFLDEPALGNPEHAGSQLSRRAMTPHWKVLTTFPGADYRRARPYPGAGSAAALGVGCTASSPG